MVVVVVVVVSRGGGGGSSSSNPTLCPNPTEHLVQGRLACG